MKRVEQNKKIKAAIIILAVLLGCCLLALGITLARSQKSTEESTAVTVSDNIITPEKITLETGKTEALDFDTPAHSSYPAVSLIAKTISNSSTTNLNTTVNSDASSAVTDEIAIALYRKHAEENYTFQVGNMFPGDIETKYFRVRVSYKDKVTVHYRANVRDGYEKLAEVLKVKIKLLTSGEVMYDGLMKDMPESVSYDLSSAGSTSSELSYEISAYLDTSVGNEYMNKDLVADFNWWVEGTQQENLVNPPKTGDSSSLMLWACLAVISGGMITFIIVRRRRKEANNG